MVKSIIPTCSRCGSFVTDHLEPEVKKEGQIREGNISTMFGYVMSV